MRVREKTIFRLVAIVCIAGAIALVSAALYAPLVLPEVTARVKAPKSKASKRQETKSHFAVPELEAFHQFAEWKLQRPLFDPPPKVEPPPPPKPKVPPPQIELYSIAMSGDTPARATFIDPEGIFLNRAVGETVLTNESRPGCRKSPRTT